MSLSLNATIALLTNIAKSYYHNGTVHDLDGNNYGPVDSTASDKLAVKAKDMAIVIDGDGKTYIVWKNNKKTIKKLSERATEQLPKGAIAFPNADIVLLDALSSGKMNAKDRSKLISRLIPDEVKDIVIYDSLFWMDGHSGDWNVFVYVDRTSPDVLKWGLCNDHAAKWYLPCASQMDAFEHLRAKAREETISIAKKAA